MSFGSRFGEVLGVVLFGLGPAVLVFLWVIDVIRPGSFGRRGERTVAAWPWWFWGLCALVVFFAEGTGAGIGAMIMGPGGEAAKAAGRTLTVPEQAMSSLTGGVLGAATGISLLLLISSRTPGRPSETGVGLRVTRRALGQGLVAIMLALPVVQMVGFFGQWLSMKVRGVEPAPISHETLRLLVEHKTDAWAWALAMAAVVLAPIVEELIFRVYLQSAMLRLTGSSWTAVLVASALFAAIHLGGGVKLENSHVLLSLFTLGAAMGIAYERTRNVVVPIVMHMVFNGVNVALTAWG